MRVLLINADSRFNIAIRRLYACYLASGDDVSQIDAHLPAYPHRKKITVDASDYDKVWVSNLFEVNADRIEVVGCDDVDRGGIGSHEPSKRLPE